MAAKKKSTPTTKRPPRQVWITYWKETGQRTGSYATRKEALLDVCGDEAVAGPYVLAERRGQE